MRIHEGTAADALAAVQSTPDGLSTDEARRRLVEFGPNRVQRPAGKPLPLRFLAELTHLFAAVLWVAAGLAFVGEAYQPGQGMALLAWAIIAVIVINATFSFWQEYRAERAITALEDLLPREVTVRRDGRDLRVPATEVVPGDVLLLEEGDDAAADGRVLQASALRVSSAILTGESVPTVREPEPARSPDVARASNVVLAGTSIVSGRGRVVVFATGMETELGRIARLTHRGEEPLSPLQREVVALTRAVSVLATALGIACFAAGRWIGLGFWETFVFAIGIIVANVPEGLLPTVTLSLAMASQRMSRRNALIRHLPAVEALGSSTVIVSDKTGTLTQNRMVARRVHLAGRTLDVDGLAVAAPEMARLAGALGDAAASCHNVHAEDRDGRVQIRGDPMEVALVELGARLGHATPSGVRTGELPFDSRRRRLSTVHQVGDRHVLFCKGAPETVLPLCSTVLGSGAPRRLGQRERQELNDACTRLAREGHRVLAYARRALPSDAPQEAVEEHLELIGLVALEDPPRPEVALAIQTCHAAGIRVLMVTGDHALTATAMARQIGLVSSMSPVVIEGDHLDRLTDTELQLALDEPELLFARTTPEQKMRVVQALQRKGEIVAATGDGVNDAPALRQADVGIAMGRCGTEVARASADVVLLDDNFATIVSAVEEGRAVFANIRKFITYILTSNVPELVPYLAMVLARVPLALPMIQILAIDLGTDMVPALGLGAEEPEPGLMNRPPRPRTQHLWDLGLFARAYLFLGMLEALAGMALFFLVLSAGGWTPGTVLSPDDPLYRQATTACLAGIVITQVVNVFLCRSEREPAWSGALKFNRWIVAGIGTELVLLGLLVGAPWAHAVFRTAPVPPWVWLAAIPFALAMLAAEEARKAVVRWMARRTSALARGAPGDLAGWAPAGRPR